jgi:hypothetical protein
MRFAWLIVLLAGCRASEPKPAKEPTVREWLDNSDAGRDVLESGKPLRFNDWE